VPPDSSPVSIRAAPRIPWLGLAAAALLVTLLAVYPPLRIGSRSAVAQSAVDATAAAFDPVAFVAGFWTDRLLPAAARAPSVGPLLADLRHSPAAALQAHGRRVGLGHAVYYFARGTGRVTAIESSRVIVEIDGVLVAVRTGPVFGNVTRDGCGLLEVNQVPGLAEFNALSAELNRRIEQEVQPPLKAGVTVGAMLTFAGCAEAPESLPAAGAPLLTFIPLEARLTP